MANETLRTYNQNTGHKISPDFVNEALRRGAALEVLRSIYDKRRENGVEPVIGVSKGNGFTNNVRILKPEQSQQEN